MYDQVEVGKKLKELRLQKEYTQIDIAEKLNVSRQAVSRWETGSSYPDGNKLMLLGELYGVSVDELLGQEKEETGQGEGKEDSPQKERFNWEYLSLIVILVVSLVSPMIGTVVSITVLAWLIKKRKFYKLIIIIGIVCVFVNLYFMYSFYGPQEYETHIEKVD